MATPPSCTPKGSCPTGRRHHSMTPGTHNNCLLASFDHRLLSMEWVDQVSSTAPPEEGRVRLAGPQQLETTDPRAPTLQQHLSRGSDPTSPSPQAVLPQATGAPCGPLAKHQASALVLKGTATVPCTRTLGKSECMQMDQPTAAPLTPPQQPVPFRQDHRTLRGGQARDCHPPDQLGG